ncbi:MAG TPA: NAD(P)-dependent alcohol dehydrogenase [Solirubrobacteraceae bacterium]|nr:NAD(P)-dependent alcohol dehydrogenase [Solirubrobacteraceae bacterium]
MAIAAVTEAAGGEFVLCEVELGELRDDEVLIDVSAAGICHTDLVCRDQWIPVPLPAVLGHEGAGVVRAVGSAVKQVHVGERVGMTFDSCGACPSCLAAKPSYCHSFFEHNFAASRPDDESSAITRGGEEIHSHFFGQSSFATLAVARERNVVGIESAIPLEIAAPFGCGFQTGAGAVLNSLALPAGSTLAVFGTGAVGICAILAAAIAGAATIVGIDRVPARLELARELGATHTIDAGETDALAEIRAITGGGADFALETTGVPAVLRTAVDCLTPRGTAGVIGAPPFGAEVALDVNVILTGGRVVRGIVEGDSVPQAFLPALIRHWEAGRFPVERLMRHYDFDQINEAARDAEQGRVIKPVLRMR